MVPNRVTCDMVSNVGGRFNTAGIDGSHTLSLLVVHDRATEDTHTHTGKERPQEKQDFILTLIVGTVHKPRQGGINSIPLRVTHRY